MTSLTSSFGTSFSASITAWQNFYLLLGTAAATLIGLMFIAITFGASLVTPETSPNARAFLDPTFTHFVHVLFTACLMTVPTMGSTTLGVILLVGTSIRATSLVRVHRHMKEAQRTNKDVELSDWMSGIIIPALCFTMLLVTGAAFLARLSFAFDALAIVTVLVLLNGVFSAWELMVWLAVTRSARAESRASRGDASASPRD